MLPLPTSNICAFPQGHRAAYFFFLIFQVFLIFSSVTCFRRQFLRKIRQNQKTLLRFILRRLFLSYLILCNTSALVISKAKHPRQCRIICALPAHFPKISLQNPLLQDHRVTDTSSSLLSRFVIKTRTDEVTNEVR